MNNRYKVLILEDKPIIRKGIIKMIEWDTLPVSLCSEGDGEDGLRKIDTLVPDIVITDIEMEGNNGIEILAHIVEHNMPIQTIVISAYDKFEYAQHALRCGTIDYILKPVDPDELNKTVEKACTKLDESKRDLDDSIQHEREVLFSTLLFEETPLLKNNYLKDLPTSYFMTRRITILAAWTRRNIDMQDTVGSAIKKKDTVEEVIVLKKNRLHYVVILYQADDSGKNLNKIIITTIKNCSKMDSKREKEFLFMGLSTPGSTIDDLKRCKKEAEKALLETVFTSDMFVTEFSKKIKKRMPLSIYYDEDALTYQLISGNNHDLTQTMEKIFHQFNANTDKSWEELEELILTLYYTLIKIKGNHHKLVEQWILELNNIDRMLEMGSIQAVENLVCEHIFQAQDMIFRRYNDSLNEITRIREFIKTNYKRQLSLQILSEIFHLNPTYLSTLFKKISGIGFKEYLNKTRIQNSLLLLEQTNLSISKIAHEVGFDHENYFFKVFKLHQGITPSEYRETLLLNRAGSNSIDNKSLQKNVDDDRW